MVTIMPPSPTLGSLFSGIGGMDRGLEQAGYELVWACEANEAAASIFRVHWPNVPVYPDVRQLSAERLIADGCPLPDVIAAGSPCQDVSQAGRRAGLMRGERSNLFFDFIRLLRECQPKAFVWENVPGLFSLNDGRDFRVAVDSFARAGYALDLDVLDSRFFGVAQRRRRIFAVGIRPDVLLASPSGLGFAAQITAEIASAAIGIHRPDWVPDLPAVASGLGVARRVALLHDHGGLTAASKILADADPDFGWSRRVDDLTRVVGPTAAREAVKAATVEFETTWLLSLGAWREALITTSWISDAGMTVPFAPLLADIVDELSAATGDTPSPALARLVDRAGTVADGWAVPDVEEPMIAAAGSVALRAEALNVGTRTCRTNAAALDSAATTVRSYVDAAFSSLFGPLEHRGVWDDALAVADSSDTADHRVA